MLESDCQPSYRIQRKYILQWSVHSEGPPRYQPLMRYVTQAFKAVTCRVWLSHFVIFCYSSGLVFSGLSYTMLHVALLST